MVSFKKLMLFKISLSFRKAQKIYLVQPLKNKRNLKTVLAWFGKEESKNLKRQRLNKTIFNFKSLI